MRGRRGSSACPAGRPTGSSTAPEWTCPTTSRTRATKSRADQAEAVIVIPPRAFWRSVTCTADGSSSSVSETASRIWTAQRLAEDALVVEACEVELQRLRLEAEGARLVPDRRRVEVGLGRDGTHRGQLVAHHLDGRDTGVRKRLQPGVGVAAGVSERHELVLHSPYSRRVPEDYFGERVAERYDDSLGEMGDPLSWSRPWTSSPISPGPARRSSSGSAPGRHRAAAAAAGRPRARDRPLGRRWSPGCVRSRAATRIGVTIGDFATTKVERPFSLAYLVFNTIMNLTTQDEQVACFRNVAAHLEPGGRFVVEVMRAGAAAAAARRDHPRLSPSPRRLLGFDEYDVVDAGLGLASLLAWSTASSSPSRSPSATCGRPSST